MKLLSPSGKFALLLFCTPVILFGQSTLRGTVSDSSSREPIIGANVIIVGTSLGAATDIDGGYVITGIPQRLIKVRVSCIGYEPKTSELDFSASKTPRLEFQLKPAVILGEEVVVTAQMRGQLAAINQQITSNTILNVISEEKIQELPDANAAEAIGRLPGVSLIRSGGEANKVLLRGLPDKFAAVTIDGVRVPPTDADSRGVDLSMISQGSLAGVELYKALTPDRDADAIAGSINMVTRKAPSDRLVRADLKGDYNHLMKSTNQYDFALRYGERFFNDILGIQLVGNLEKKIRSSEKDDIDYDQTVDANTSYAINDFTLTFTDEMRKRNGLTLLLDINTPDSGSIRLSNMYSGTNRDFISSNRDYPTAGTPFYVERYQQQDINTFNSALNGENYLLGLEVNWGASFAQSKSSNPFDYEMDFTEPAVDSSGMFNPPSSLKSNPELLIPFAWNNFRAAYCTTAYNRTENNLDKEKTGYVDVAKKYLLSNTISGEIKVGGKYREKDRYKNNYEGYAPYYLGYFKRDEILPDGSIVPKNYDGSWNGTRFAQFLADFQAGTRQTPSFSEFLDYPPPNRNLFDKYLLNPLVGRGAMNLWFDLNKNGYEAQTQAKVEFISNQLTQGDWYQVVERVSAGYIMNTSNIGPNITFIAGLRVEQENNDYVSRFTPVAVGTPLFPSGTFRDTSATHEETILLPSFHLTLRPTAFVNVRLAAYRGLSRPDFNMRLAKFFAQSASGSNSALVVGNPNLKTAKAWNYEVNTSIFANNIGLISISGFYKEITDMYQMLSGAATSGTSIIDYFGLKWRDAFGGSNYSITVPYSSPKPTKVWGFEFEHQINFGFLPGLLKNFVLTYNASLIRSEIYILGTITDTTYEYRQILPAPAPPTRFPVYMQRIAEKKQRLDGEPEFFGNIALGYDIGGFSARVSIYHQGEYNRSFSANSRGDAVQGSFTRVDLSLKHQFTKHLTIFFNVNNLNNTVEDDFLANRVNGYQIPNTSERYGTTADLGVRITL